MQRYVPLHPQVVDAIRSLVRNRPDDKAMFTHEAFDDGLRSHKIPLVRVNTHFVCIDLSKFAEQHGDVIGWERSNRAYVLSHGVSGVDWSHYIIRYQSTCVTSTRSIEKDVKLKT